MMLKVWIIDPVLFMPGANYVVKLKTSKREGGKAIDATRIGIFIAGRRRLHGGRSARRHGWERWTRGSNQGGKKDGGKRPKRRGPGGKKW